MGALCCTAFSLPAQAASQTSDQCTLSGVTSSGLAPCPNVSGGGYKTSSTALTIGSGYDAVKSDNAASAVIPIYVSNYCYWVDNTNANAIFVPFKTSKEWLAFINSAPGLLGGSSIKLTDCAVPYSANSAPSQQWITPNSAWACSPSQVLVNTPTVYGRASAASAALYPNPATPGASFSCHNGVTAMTSSVQWKALDLGNPVPSGTLTWANNNFYSADMTLSASPPSVTTGAADVYGNPTSPGYTTLYWSINPYYLDSSVTCSVSPGGWGPDGNGNPRSGSAAYAINTTTVFQLSCTSHPSNLTSVSTITVGAYTPPYVPPYVPPADSGFCCSGDSGVSGGG